MAQEGARVMLSDRDGPGAQAVAGEIAAAGGTAEALALNVTDDAALHAAITAAAERHGRLDILHSHAGLQVEGRLEEVSVAQMDASWALNERAMRLNVPLPPSRLPLLMAIGVAVVALVAAVMAAGVASDSAQGQVTTRIDTTIHSTFDGSMVYQTRPTATVMARPWVQSPKALTLKIRASAG